MYSEDNLRSAICAGVFTQDSVDAFKLHITKINATPSKDEERVRLVTGLNDIFVVIACVLLLLAVGGIGASFRYWVGSIAVASVAWGLAEFFTRKRQMALPSITLMLAFVGGVAFTAGLLIIDLFNHWETDNPFSIIAIPSIICGVSAAYLHWIRFSVSMTVAVGATMLLGLFYSILIALIPKTEALNNIIFFLIGISLFVYAMFWDIADRNRQTYKSDVAFWLHLFAAPLIVHPIFAEIGIFGTQISLIQSFIVISLYIAIALISLLIDRRALMISALTYVLYAFTTLLRQYDFISLNFAITALVIGLALLLLAAFWHKFRNFVIQYIPSNLRNSLAPERSN